MTASSVLVNVPIRSHLDQQRICHARSMPSSSRSGLVTKMSSPTDAAPGRRSRPSAAQPSQSASLDSGSSIDTSGRRRCARRRVIWSAHREAPRRCAGKFVGEEPAAAAPRRGRAIAGRRVSPPGLEGPADQVQRRGGAGHIWAKPLSSPRPVGQPPSFFRPDLSGQTQGPSATLDEGANWRHHELFECRQRYRRVRLKLRMFTSLNANARLAPDDQSNAASSG